MTDSWFYISRVSIQGIRGFREKLEIDFPINGVKARSRPNDFVSPHIFLGCNGTCKTTILRCIAIGLSPLDDANAFISEPIGNLLRSSNVEGTIAIELRRHDDDKTPVVVTTRIKRKGDREVARTVDSEDRQIPDDLFLAGYGVGRKSEGTDSGRAFRIIDSAYTLFNYDSTLISTELSMRRQWQIVLTLQMGVPQWHRGDRSGDLIEWNPRP